MTLTLDLILVSIVVVVFLDGVLLVGVVVVVVVVALLAMVVCLRVMLLLVAWRACRSPKANIMVEFTYIEVCLEHRAPVCCCNEVARPPCKLSPIETIRAAISTIILCNASIKITIYAGRWTNAALLRPVFRVNTPARTVPVRGTHLLPTMV